ncbi:MAG: MotA/TolQ/ExbB proton channel family protein [Candidatus Azobacteroides sp.]|nr:MotA/TolQ/ExbB proton channel family protein [Candidatus Azobacteroides sp.]
METKTQTGEKSKRVGKKSRGISAGIVIVCCFVIALLVYFFIFGDPANFVNNDPHNHPLPGKLLGTIYKGGVTVVLIMTLLLTVLVLSVERFIALSKAKGTGNLISFVYDVKADLKKGSIAGAEALCAKQKGSVAAIVDAGLKKYREMESQSLPKETKIEEIKAELEEATALELPSMQQNLPVIATISTLGTLFGLFGTVLGMIRSFSALAAAGSTDSVALSAGISEALVNTAFGIATGALAIITYAFFTGKIDNMTYAIDEMGFALTQTYAETHEK